jgi:hypothetical protein
MASLLRRHPSDHSLVGLLRDFNEPNRIGGHSCAPAGCSPASVRLSRGLGLAGVVAFPKRHVSLSSLVGLPWTIAKSWDDAGGAGGFSMARRRPTDSRPLPPVASQWPVTTTAHRLPPTAPTGPGRCIAP